MKAARAAGLMLQLACAIASSCLLACDSVGRALVGSDPPGQGFGLQCAVTPCEEMKFAGFQTPQVLELRLDTCVTSDPASCEVVSETIPGLSRATAGACMRSVSLDDDAFDATAARDLRCAAVRLSRTNSGGMRSVRIDDAHWSNLEVEIATRDAFALELANPVLDHVRVRLRGPITLRILDTKTVTELSVDSESDGSAVELRDVTAKRVMFGSEPYGSAEGVLGGPFAGRLAIRRSTLASAHIAAAEVAFESMVLNEVAVDVERADWVDVTGVRVRLAVDEAVISASKLNGFEVERCGELRLHKSSLASYAIPACDPGATLVFGTSLTRGQIDGAIFVDGAQIQNSVFGIAGATHVQLWDADLVRVNFCAKTEHVEIAGEGSFLCAYCQELDASEVPIDACRHEDDDTRIARSCSAFEEAAQCDPAPIRMRPPFN